jgi:protein arginine N-methyltransferase 1
MYTIHDFGDMIADRGRTDAYAQALRSRITPDSVVIDLGAGAGIMTLLACDAGARRVYAIESANMIQAARDLVRVNGFAPRVEFIQAASGSVVLPERADILVSEIHGVLPFFLGGPRSIIDARDRLLKPGGAIVPMADVIMGAIVSAPDAHHEIVGPWHQFPQFDGGPALARATGAWRAQRFSPSALVTDPAHWLTLDYGSRDDPNGRGTLSWTVANTARAHGLCLWFDCRTAPGFGFSNSPLSGEKHVFGQAFLPWPDACSLEPGDRVVVDLRADLVGEDYLWGWDTTIHAAGAEGPPKARFDQRQLSSVPFSKDWLRKTASTFVPVLNNEAAIDRMVLDLMMNATPLEHIARQVAERFPDRFPEWRTALTRVGKLSMRYSE